MSDQLLDQYLEERVYGPMRADGWPGFDNPEDELAVRKEVEKSLNFAVYKINHLFDFSSLLARLSDRLNKK